jgi:CRP-like cAMP-binding protein
MAIEGISMSKIEANKLLSCLCEAEIRRFSGELKQIELRKGDILYQPYQTIDHLYFPVDSTVSLLSTTINGKTVEVGTVGSEGIVESMAALESETTLYQAVVQIPGYSIIMDMELFQHLLKSNTRFNQLLLRYIKAFFTKVAQSSVCNRFHTLEERLCRRLLESRDQIESNTIPFTQESLASILGAERANITRSAALLQQSGIINYGRGRISILNPGILESTACECYFIVKKVFSELFSK